MRLPLIPTVALAALVTLAACWTGAPVAVAAAPPAPGPPSRAAEQCRDEGAILHVTACRRDDALQWRAVNQGSLPLWVFLRMPSMRDGSLADTNALVTGVEGQLVVVKATPMQRIEERAFGVVALDPGAEAHGDVPIGRRLAGHTVHLVLATDRAIGVVHDVALEVGFAEQRPGDSPRRADRRSSASTRLASSSSAPRPSPGSRRPPPRESVPKRSEADTRSASPRART